jgi:glycosyltransferase involved in cell wall biosynthesis
MPIRATREENVTWTQEAIASVKMQSYPDWELYLVTDQSTVSLAGLKPVLKGDDRLHAMKAKGRGVAAARNTGVAACKGTLLLPMDHDDILPSDSLETLLEAWDSKGKDFGVVYGDVVSFGTDFERFMKMPQFLFQTLLNTLIMPIGSLHSKASSIEIGGWKGKFQGGLEDWAYWIEMAVNGYWGHHVPQVTYHYRRHPHGRLAALRTEDKMDAQRALIREHFADYYNGKEPKMCYGCGRSKLVSGAGGRVRYCR